VVGGHPKIAEEPKLLALDKPMMPSELVKKIWLFCNFRMTSNHKIAVFSA
jgi:hypothetical protein